MSARRIYEYRKDDKYPEFDYNPYGLVKRALADVIWGQESAIEIMERVREGQLHRPIAVPGGTITPRWLVVPDDELL